MRLPPEGQRIYLEFRSDGTGWWVAYQGLSAFLVDGYPGLTPFLLLLSNLT
jgi:hypothetical protein